MKKVVISIAIAGFLVSCWRKQATTTKTEMDSLAVRDSIARSDSIKRIMAIPRGEARLDFTARFIAGLLQSRPYSVTEAEKDSSWK